MLFYVIMLLTKKPTISVRFYCSFQMKHVFAKNKQVWEHFWTILYIRYHMR